MKWLLDTNVVSETIRPRPDKAVLAWMAAQEPNLTAISIVTMAELRAGILATTNDDRRHQLTHWFEVTLPDWFQERVLPVTIGILTDWLVIGDALASKGRTRNPADLLLAATARIHGLMIVSRNTRDFIGTGIVVYNPWTDETHRMN